MGARGASGSTGVHILRPVICIAITSLISQAIQADEDECNYQTHRSNSSATDYYDTA